MSGKTCAFLAFFIALFLLIWTVPVSANEDDWDNLTATLGPENPIISKDGYTLEVLKFDSYGMVWVEVLKDGVTLEDAILESNSSGWCYMDDRNLRLKACNITDQRDIPMFGSLYCPKAEIVFETKRHVKDNVTLELDLEADKGEYLLNEEVIVELELRNTGEVKAENLRLDVDSDRLLIRDGGPERLTLSKGSTKEAKLRFKFPNTIKDNYNITVNVRWEDNNGNHSLSQTEEVKVTEPLEIYKNVESETFSGSPVYVTVSVENSQTRKMRVSLLDLLPVTFTPVNGFARDEKTLNENALNGKTLNGNAELSWDFELAPGERKTYSYYISSEELGAHRVPQARAYTNLGGQAFIKSSDIENVITVYENHSYREYKAKKAALTPSLPPSLDEESVFLFSGEDFSKYVDEGGYALLNIFILSEDWNAFVFIPRETRILDNEKRALTVITIKENDSIPLDSGLTAIGKCYEVGPQEALFSPFVFFVYFCEKEVSDPLSVYLYKEGKWVYANSICDKTDNYGSFVLTPVDKPTAYLAVSSSSEVTLKVNIK